MDERITYTAESLVMLAAVLLADAQAGRGNAEMKRRSAECVMRMSERLRRESACNICLTPTQK